MITKSRIKKQGGRVLAINPFEALVAAHVVDYDEDDTPLVKFPCLFKPRRVPYEDLFEFPIPEEIDHEVSEAEEEVTLDES